LCNTTNLIRQCAICLAEMSIIEEVSAGLLSTLLPLCCATVQAIHFAGAEWNTEGTCLSQTAIAL